MTEEALTLYTFKQPAKGGYYYIVVKATSVEEASQITADIVGTLKNLTGRLQFLNQFTEGALVLSPAMQRRLDEMGYAHIFVKTFLPPYHERYGHIGILPK